MPPLSVVVPEDAASQTMKEASLSPNNATNVTASSRDAAMTASSTTAVPSSPPPPMSTTTLKTTEAAARSSLVSPPPTTNPPAAVNPGGIPAFSAAAPSAAPVDSKESPSPSSRPLWYALGLYLAQSVGPLVENADEWQAVAQGFRDYNQAQKPVSLPLELLGVLAQRSQRLQDQLADQGRQQAVALAQLPHAQTLASGVVLCLEPSTTPATPAATTSPTATTAPASTTPNASRRRRRPTDQSTVEVHYHATLADGSVLDSTHHKSAVRLPLSGMIPGWRQALLRMEEGQAARVAIPPDQAYGTDAYGKIPGQSTLLLHTRLVRVVTHAVEDNEDAMEES